MTRSAFGVEDNRISKATIMLMPPGYVPPKGKGKKSRYTGPVVDGASLGLRYKNGVVSKADRSDRQVVGRRTAEGAAIGAGTGAAGIAGAGAYVVRAHKKMANRYEDVHQTGSTATERVNALHEAHHLRQEGQRYRRLIPRASRNAAIIGGVLGAGAGATSGAVHHFRNRQRHDE